MADNTLLWQVELMPPSAQNVKTVSQAIDQVNRTKIKNPVDPSTNKSIKDLKTDLMAVRVEIDKAEQASRFGNKTSQESIQVIEAQQGKLQALRGDIKALNLSREQELKLMNMWNARNKQANLAINRTEENWQGMAKSTGQANATLMSFGRILSDLPYGFIGISNNLEQSTMQFSHLSRSTDSTKGAFKALAGQLMSKSGLLILAGSAIPAALSFATIGVRNWGLGAKDSAEDTKVLSEEIQRLTDGFEELHTTQGEDDPFGVLSIEQDVQALDQMERNLKSVFDLEKEINMFQRDNADMGEEIFMVRAGLRKEQDMILESVGLTREEFENILEESENLDEKLGSVAKRMTGVSPLQSSMVDMWREINESVELYELGIADVVDIEGVHMNNLTRFEKELTRMVNDAREEVMSGNEEAMPELRMYSQLLDKVQDTTDDFPELPELDIVEPEDVDMLESVNKELDKLTGQDNLDLELLFPDRSKTFDKMRDREFKVRTEMLGDMAQETQNHFKLIEQIEAEAQENGLEGHRQVESLKTALTEKHAYRRQQIEIEREQEITDAKMSLASEAGDFMAAVQNVVGEENKVFALAELAVQKGLKIAEVTTEAAARSFELNAMGDKAIAQSGIALASGNVPQATALMSAGANAKLQAGKIKSLAAKTVGVIAATGLFEAAGILGGGGGGGSAGGSSRGRSQSDRGIGFNTVDYDDREEVPPTRFPSSMETSPQSGNITLIVQNSVDEKGMATAVRRGERGRQKNIRNLISIPKD